MEHNTCINFYTHFYFQLYKLKVFTKKNNTSPIYKLELPEIDLSEPLFNLINYVGKSIISNTNPIIKSNLNKDITKVLEKIQND